MVLRVNDNIGIEEWELTEQFVRASGPGGQNVNKVSTAVELRFSALGSPNLPDPVKKRLRRLAGQKWTEAGEVVIFVQDTRSQARNREIARDRLAELVQRATVVPKKRRPTRPTKGSVERRLKADCVEKLRNQSVADFLRKPMKRNSRKALTTRQRMAARERM
ncbi:MAG: aminoacyl-tRNA hydrolase [Rhodobacteraceae bacterium]|nr:aminoacyl-tRNA hydrolase [Paracoccaceae bacterium]